jgi:hypothetical protein
MITPSPSLALTLGDLTATLRTIAAGPHSLARRAAAIPLPIAEPTRAEREAELRDAPPCPERWARTDEQLEIEAGDLRPIPLGERAWR